MAGCELAGSSFDWRVGWGVAGCCSAAEILGVGTSPLVQVPFRVISGIFRLSGPSLEKWGFNGLLLAHGEWAVPLGSSSMAAHLRTLSETWCGEIVALLCLGLVHTVPKPETLNPKP